MVRLLFVDNSRPVTGKKVRLEGVDGDLETDEDGQLRVDLEAGSHRVEIEVEDGWLTRTVEVERRDQLVVVDISRERDAIAQTLQHFSAGGGWDLGDRYDWVCELGRGGMGVVVRARDTLLNRDVAIKVLSAEMQGNEEAEGIFLTEARSMARLSHANLVAVHDVLSHGGRSMMVVEYITGRNLQEIIDESGAIPQEKVIDVGVQLCRVIDYLHGEGVIHRDLKPSNLMVEDDGAVTLIDFGLARSLEQIANKGTKVRGTPAYMAPEQVMGLELSPATDIYQIGATLFEALTGRLPFPRGDAAYQHVHEVPPRVQEIAEGVVDGLSDLVAACLAKRPEDRPASAADLVEALEAIEGALADGIATRDATRPMLIAPSERPDQASKQTRRSTLPEREVGQQTDRSLAWLVGLAALVVVLGGVAWFLAAGDQGEAGEVSTEAIAQGADPSTEVEQAPSEPERVTLAMTSAREEVSRAQDASAGEIMGGAEAREGSRRGARKDRSGARERSEGASAASKPAVPSTEPIEPASSEVARPVEPSPVLQDEVSAQVPEVAPVVTDSIEAVEQMVPSVEAPVVPEDLEPAGDLEMMADVDEPEAPLEPEMPEPPVEPEAIKPVAAEDEDEASEQEEPDEEKPEERSPPSAPVSF